MERESSCCDFCGASERLRRYSADVPGVDWFACLDCVEFIRNEDWDGLIERGVAAHARMQAIPPDEQNVLRRQVQDLLKAFRQVCLATVESASAHR